LQTLTELTTAISRAYTTKGRGTGSGDGNGPPGSGGKTKDWLDKFADELAHGGAIATQQLGHDTKDPTGSPYGVIGGMNPNGPKSPIVQTIAAALQISAVILLQTSAFEQALRKAIKTGTTLVSNLSAAAAKKLAGRYGWKMAAALNQTGTIAPYEAMREFTQGLGGQYQAHHILEKNMMERFGLGNPDHAPSVILTGPKHAEITTQLKEVTRDVTTKEGLWKAYQEVYSDYPQWLNAIRKYFE
jgi:hypothetical protein